MEQCHLVGYHGTTQDNASSILAENLFRKSKRKNDWLGTGIYFFEHKAHAIWWTTHSRFNGKETAIIEVLLEFIDNQLLDLDDPAQLQELDNLVRLYFEKANHSEPTTKPNFASDAERWCFACNLIKQADPTIAIIRYTFPVGKRNYFSGFSPTQRQICVSDDSVIKCIEKV